MYDSYDVLLYDGGVAPGCLPALISSKICLTELRICPYRGRILELGCGVGTNLLSLSTINPIYEYVGVDRSSRQIELASQRSSKLDITGIRWIAADATELGPYALGVFDYIICHGVLSWVPVHVRHKLLDTIHAHLAPGGVAYISYNIRPGWGHGQGLREALLALVQQELEPVMQLQRMRLVLELMAEAAGATALGTLTRETAQQLLKYSDDYLFHEYLEADNHPLRFTEFVNEASRHGLRWIAEAQPSAHADLPLRVREFLDGIADPLLREQTRDDLCMNTFRMSLCMRSDQPVSAVKDDIERISNLHLAAPLLPPPNWNWSLLQPMDFLRPDGLSLRAIFPVAKAACLLLAETWPGSLSFEQLFQTSQTRMLEAGIAPRAEDRHRLLGFLHAAALAGRIEILAWPRPTSPRWADPPRAWPLARLLIEEGKTWVTTSLHTNLPISSEERSALLLCDGRRTRDQLAEAISGDPSLAPMVENLDRRLVEWHRKGLLCSDLST